MSDNIIINKAREAWCELSVWRPCPPEVVAALLDVLEDTSAQITTCRCIGCEIRRQQRRDDLIATAQAAITRALEGV